jgi:hypothetical protein
MEVTAAIQTEELGGVSKNRQEDSVAECGLAG